MKQAMILGVLLVMVVHCGAQNKKPPKDKLLDKKTFYTVIIDAGKKKADSIEDEVSFRSGKMGSKLMQSAEGFLKGDYAIVDKHDVDGDEILDFQGINTNSKGQSLKWEGKVFGSAIEGTATVSKNGKVKREYRFSGELKERGQKRKTITSPQ